ncbi:MAG: SulP family inorganic anion transporter [bacterium]
MYTGLLETIKNYNKIQFRKDVVAGLSVAAISLPQNMAYALIVGVEPVYGLYATIIAMVLFTFVGQSNYMIVGPTNIMALAIAGSVGGLAQGNYLEAVLLFTFLIGVSQLLFGLLKMGKLVKYVPHSLIIGLTTGAVVLIAVGQLQNILGISVNGGANLFSEIYIVFTNLWQINWITFFIGVLTVLIILLVRKVNRKLPSYLISIVAITIIAYVFNLDQKIAVVGNLPDGILRFSIPSFNWDLISSLLSQGLSVALLGLLQTLAVLKSVSLLKREEVDVNSEFIGQGIINVAASFFNGFATAGSFTNSYTNIQANAATRVAQFVSGLVFVFALLLGRGLLSYLPISALSGLVIVVAIVSIDIGEIKRNVRITQGDATIFTVTFLATIILPSIANAIYIGLITSAVVVLRKTEKINLGVLTYESEDDYFRHRSVEELSEEFEKEHFIVVNMRGNLQFSSVDNLRMKFDKVLNRGQNFILRLREIERMDITILKELERFIDKVHEEEGIVVLSGVDKAQYERMKRYGIINKVNEENVYLSDEKYFSSTKEAYDFMEIR